MEKLIQSKCKNCEDSVITKNNGKDWIHGIILENGRPWLTPINSLCQNPEGQIDGKKLAVDYAEKSKSFETTGHSLLGLSF